MIDFAPTEEQTAIRDLARQIALEQFRKLARPADEDGDMSDYFFDLLGQTGLLSPFPEEFGGSGEQSAVTHALIAEELASGDGGLTLGYLGAILPGLAVLIAGTDEQQRLLLPRCAAERCALGWSEPASGLEVRETQTTVIDKYISMFGGFDLDKLGETVRPEVLGDSPYTHLLVGVKRGVVHGAADGLRIIIAREWIGYDPLLTRLTAEQILGGLRLVVLPDHAAGVTVTPEAEPLGLRAAPRARLQLEDVPVSDSDVLGGLETGAAGAQRFIGLANVLLAALAVGTASAALDYAADYAKGRVQFGKPISSFQAIAFMAAEMAMETDAARLLVWQAAAAWDAADEAGVLRRCERARMQAVKVAQRVTTDAVQILGGAGFLQDHPVEMWMRNAEALAALG